MIFYDLKQEAQRKTMGDVTAREVELGRLGRTAHRQYNNNAMVSGPSGGGKSALLEGFAYRVALGRMPGFSDDYLPVKLDANDIRRLANSSEGLAQIAAAFRALPAKSIVFIDDFQVIAQSMDNGKTAGFQAVLGLLLERPDVSVILALADTAYQKLLGENPNFLKSFEHIPLSESDMSQTATIIQSLAPAFAAEYGISISEAASREAAALSQKLPSDKHQPLRAVHFLDECLAYAKISGAKDLAPAHVRHVFSEKTGIPGDALDESGIAFLNTLEATLAASVIGQSHAVAAVADVIRRSRMGLRNPNRPYGTFLFLGTSGVGKTELAKSLAKTVYGSERLFARIDMSEFGEPHTVQRLVGAPPGYVGFESGGQLTSAVQEHPYSLVLLDEIEKAHPKIFDVFLQVFDDGRLTDGRGQTANFTNSILIATSNFGVDEIVSGFDAGTDLNSPEFIAEVMMPALMKRFRPEFLNRFDAIIVFNPLDQEALLKIAQLEIRKIETRMAEHDVHFDIDEDVLRAKIAEIADPRLGARPVKRFIEQTCERLIALQLMEKST